MSEQPSLLYALSEVNDVIDERLAPSLDAAGLTRAQSHLLYILKANGPSRLSALADQQRCVRSNVTRLVRMMEKRGWVERTSDPSDKRARLISMTAQGEAILEPMLHATKRLEQELFAGLGEAQRKLLMELALRAAALLDRSPLSDR